MTILAVTQGAGQAHEADGFYRRVKLGADFADEFVQRLRVFLDAIKPGDTFFLFFIRHAQSQNAAFGVGESTNRFQRLAHHLAGNALEIERAAFAGDEQAGDARSGLGGGEINHLRHPLGRSAPCGI